MHRQYKHKLQRLPEARNMPLIAFISCARKLLVLASITASRLIRLSTSATRTCNDFQTLGVRVIYNIVLLITPVLGLRPSIIL